jgi:hypothetical protein
MSQVALPDVAPNSELSRKSLRAMIGTFRWIACARCGRCLSRLLKNPLTSLESL